MDFTLANDGLIKQYQAQNKNGLVERWHLSRPERLNALGPTMADALYQRLNTIKKKVLQTPKSEVSALLITAEGIESQSGKIWIAGGDLKELSILNSTADAAAYARKMREVIDGLQSLPIPVVTYLEGSAIGGGAEFFLSGDVRFVTGYSKLVWKQLQMGLPLGYGSTRRLVDLIGLAQAQKLIWTCASVDCRQMIESGLASDEVGSLDEVCLKIEQLLEAGTSALSVQKKYFNATHRLPGCDEDALFASIWKNEVHKRNIEQFLNDK